MSTTTFKNKFQSQQIHKRFNNRHRSSKPYCNKNVSTLFTTTDLDRVLRDCEGRTTNEILSMSFDYDLVVDDDLAEISIQTNEEDAKETPDLSILDFEWACEVCTFVNWPDNVECEMCNAPCWKLESLENDRSSLTPSIPNNLELAQPEMRRPVPFVMIDFLMSVRKRVSKAERRREQMEKEKADGNRWLRERESKTSKKKKPIIDTYPGEILARLPPAQRLMRMHASPNVKISALPIPPRLKGVVQRVVQGEMPVMGLAFHGTDEKNTRSIVTKGLLVGGPETRRLHGAAHGVGVYCSDRLSIAQGYARGGSAPIFACLVLKEPKIVGSIFVVPDSTLILPVYLLYRGSSMYGHQIVREKLGPVEMTHFVTIVNAKKVRWHKPTVPTVSPRNEIPYGAVVGGQFKGRINLCDETRKVRRMWPAKG